MLAPAPACPPLTRADQAVLLRNEWFAALEPEDRAALIGAGRLERRPAGSVLLEDGAPVPAVFAVLRGQVRERATSADGREFVLSLHGPSMWLGITAMLDGEVSSVEALAEDELTLLVIPAGRFAALLRERPTLERELFRLVVRRYRFALDWIITSATLGIEARLAIRLLTLSGGWSGVFAAQGRVLRLSQDALAVMVGGTRQRIAQILRAWEAKGLVRTGLGRVEVLDGPGLESLAGRLGERASPRPPNQVNPLSPAASKGRTP